MPTSALASIPQTYPKLLSAARRVLIDRQLEIDHGRVRSYHETGRLITEHSPLLVLVIFLVLSI